MNVYGARVHSGRASNAPSKTPEFVYSARLLIAAWLNASLTFKYGDLAIRV